MMASLVKSASELLSANSDEERLRYITFSEAMIAAEESLYDLYEETWQEMCLRPSPPVTPESLSPAAGVPTGVGVHEEVHVQLQDVAESLLCNIMEYDEYEQIIEALHEAEFALTSTSEELLIQDCMWSSGTNCDCSSDKTQSNTCSMTPSSSSDIKEAIKKPSSTNSEPLDCIEPSVVFPPSLHVYTKSSELTDIIENTISEEEIDVVTVAHHSDQHYNTDNDMYHHSRQPPHHSVAVRSCPNNIKTLKKSAANLCNTTNTSSVPSATVGGNTKPSVHRRKRCRKRRSRLGLHECDEETRRASHNISERKRRNDLKSSFDILRMCIPDLENNVKASKILILREAVEYIKFLQSSEHKYNTDLLREETRYSKLKDKLTYLMINAPATV